MSPAAAVWRAISAFGRVQAVSHRAEHVGVCGPLLDARGRGLKTIGMRTVDHRVDAVLYALDAIAMRFAGSERR